MFNTILFAGEGVSGPCVGVAGGVAAAPQPGMGIFAMMASLGTMPLPGTAGPEQQQPHPAGTTGQQGDFTSPNTNTFTLLPLFRRRVWHPGPAAPASCAAQEWLPSCSSSTSTSVKTAQYLQLSCSFTATITQQWQWSRNSLNIHKNLINFGF